MQITVTRVDGATYTVDTIVADQVAYSEARHRRKWPTMQDDPILFGNYLAFAASRRTGQFTGTWEEFCTGTAGVDMPDDDAEGGLPSPF